MEEAEPNSSRMNRSVFDGQLNDRFFTTTEKYPLPAVTEKTLSNTVYISLTQKRTKVIAFNLELWDHSFVFLKTRDSRFVSAVMDVRYCRIRKIHSHAVAGKVFTCIRFFKKQMIEDLYFELDTVADLWFESLKKMCVLTRFASDYTTIKVLGKGNFAKVFLIQRNDKKYFAAKVFDKKLILGDDLEQVAYHHIEMPSL